MKKIYKYKMTTWKTILHLPNAALVLSVQSQNNEIMLWALVDPDEKQLQERYFEIFETGKDIIDTSVYRHHIGTFQMFSGALVFHCFETLGQL